LWHALQVATCKHEQQQPLMQLHCSLLSSCTWRLLPGGDCRVLFPSGLSLRWLGPVAAPAMLSEMQPTESVSNCVAESACSLPFMACCCCHEHGKGLLALHVGIEGTNFVCGGYWGCVCKEDWDSTV
jgi:hypothetical protein